jgi:hypothetical protein
LSIFFILFIGLSRSHDFDYGFGRLIMINFLLLSMLHIYYANPGWLKPFIFNVLLIFILPEVIFINYHDHFFIIKNNSFIITIYLFLSYIIFGKQLIKFDGDYNWVVDFSFLFKMLVAPKHYFLWKKYWSRHNTNLCLVFK